MKVNPPKIPWKKAPTGIPLGGGTVKGSGVHKAFAPPPNKPASKKTNP